ATSSNPGLAETALVNAPRWWPNSSDSNNSRARPAQFRSRNGRPARGTAVVQPFRQHALTASGFTFDEHGTLRGNDLGCKLAHAQDGRTAAQKRVEYFTRDSAAAVSGWPHALKHLQQRCVQPGHFARFGQDAVGIAGEFLQCARLLSDEQERRHRWL